MNEKEIEKAVRQYDQMMLDAAKIKAAAHSNFGDALRTIRLKKGITLLGLSRKTDLSVAFISDVELGRRMFSKNSMKKIIANL